jgi:hypothetical protein
MQEIIIDEEFSRMFPVLGERTIAGLEESILEFGCVVPLILWNGILIDGHNRYQLLKKHGLPFNTINMEFASRDLVEIWIIENQIERRNLTPLQLSFYRGLHYHAEKRVVGNTTGRNQHNVELSQNETIPQRQSTATKLAEHYKVSRSTIKRDAQIANAISAIGEVSHDMKMDILSGSTRISKVQLKELASGNKEDVSAVISQIEDGTHVNRRPAATKQDGIETETSDIKPWEKQFVMMTEEFRQMLRTQSSTDDTVAVKASLRQYIGMLEELYMSI